MHLSPSGKSSFDVARLALPTFERLLEHHWKFMKQFDNFIASRVLDPRKGFLYLTHYRRGRVRKVVDRCSMSKADRGFTETKK